MLITAIILGLLSLAIIIAVIFLTKKNALGVLTAFLDTYETTLFFFVFVSLMFVGISLAKFVAKLDLGEAGVYYSTVVLQVGFSIAVLWVARKIRVKISLVNVFSSIKTGLIYFISATSVLACGGCISILYKLITGEDIEKQQAVSLFMDIDALWLRIFAGFSIIVLAPIAEELFFRGLLYPCMKGWIARYIGVSNTSSDIDSFRNKVALVASAILVSILFSLIHSSVFAFLPIFIMGIILICAYEKTNSILAPITTHMLFNFANVLIIIFSEQ